MASTTPPQDTPEPPDSPPAPKGTVEDVALIQAFYRRILEALPTQLAVFSPRGEYEYVTPSAIADPVVREWIIGRTDAEYAAVRKLPPDVPARRMATIDKVVRDGNTVTFEESFTTRDGEQRWFRRYVTPVKDVNGNVQHILGYGLDITEQRRAEEQLRQAQKMEAIGRLAGGVAHDFNNLITVIGGFAETLEGSFPVDDPRHDALLAIREAADRASGLTRQLLSFSRRAPLELTILDAHEIVTDTVNLLERVIGEKIRVTVALRASSRYIRADAGQFKQVLLNLVLNARDAMPEGGELGITTRIAPTRSVRDLESKGRRTRFIEIEVSDTGVGMSADTITRIFEPFFTTKALDKGTGLGLSTVYGIVTQLGGRVSVDSTPGRGSRFRVVLPLADDHAPVGRKAESGAQTIAAKATVLVAEDEDGVRMLVTRILRSAGLHVLEASSGSEALALVERHDGTIDLLLTDVVMGDFGGRTLADAARVMRPDLLVLYMSGYSDEEHLVDVTNPAEDFIPKPFTVNGLTERVQRLLQLDMPGRNGRPAH